MKIFWYLLGAVVLLAGAIFLLFRFVLKPSGYQSGAVPGQQTGSATASVPIPATPPPASVPSTPSWLQNLFGPHPPATPTSAAQTNQSDGVVNLIGQGIGLLGSLFGNGNNTPQSTYSPSPGYSMGDALLDDNSDYTGGILDYIDGPAYEYSDQTSYYV